MDTSRSIDSYAWGGVLAAEGSWRQDEVPPPARATGPRPLYCRPLTGAQLNRGKVYVGVDESRAFARHIGLQWGVAGQRDVAARDAASGEPLPGVFLSCVRGREIDHRWAMMAVIHINNVNMSLVRRF